MEKQQTSSELEFKPNNENKETLKEVKIRLLDKETVQKDPYLLQQFDTWPTLCATEKDFRDFIESNPETVEFEGCEVVCWGDWYDGKVPVLSFKEGVWVTEKMETWMSTYEIHLKNPRWAFKEAKEKSDLDKFDPAI